MDLVFSLIQYHSNLQDLHAAMKMLGLNPMEQEIIDLTNRIVKNGFIYFPEFCQVIHEQYRHHDEEIFTQNMFKVDILPGISICKVLSIKSLRPFRL